MIITILFFTLSSFYVILSSFGINLKLIFLRIRIEKEIVERKHEDLIVSVLFDVVIYKNNINKNCSEYYTQ